MLRRELRRVVDVNVEEDDIANVLRTEVIKREAMEGPSAEAASGKVRRGASKVIVKVPQRSVTPVHVDVSVSEEKAAQEATKS